MAIDESATSGDQAGGIVSEGGESPGGLTDEESGTGTRCPGDIAKSLDRMHEREGTRACEYLLGPMAADPPLDLKLAPLNGPARTVREHLTMFNLVFVALDPFTNESAWILPTATHVLSVFAEADCRTAWLVAGTPAECRMFLGPWSREILTFSDPDRTAIKGFGLERLPAFVHLAQDGSIVSAAEGWKPTEWKAAADKLADIMSWEAPLIPRVSDPGPFEGTPAAG